MSIFRSASFPVSPVYPGPENRPSFTMFFIENLLRAKGSDIRSGAGRVQVCNRSASHRRPGHGRSIAARAHAAFDADPVSRALRSGARIVSPRNPEAMSQGLTASAFSFNSGSGRCERCSGTGFEKIEMQFLSDLYVRCAECEGRRFQSHVLKVQVHGKSIHDVLELTVSEAIQFFARIGEQRTLSDPLHSPRRGRAWLPPTGPAAEYAFGRRIAAPETGSASHRCGGTRAVASHSGRRQRGALQPFEIRGG